LRQEKNVEDFESLRILLRKIYSGCILTNNKRLLLLSYYFPPCGMGGVQRAVKLVKYLPEFGWKVTVLTVKDIAYYNKDYSLLDEVESADIHRAGSFDPLRIARLLTGPKELGKICKTHGKFTALYQFIDRKLCVPDTKMLWNVFAYYKACRILRKKSHQALLSTAPPFSSHLLALRLSKKFNIPWIADFRDGWTNNDLIQIKGTICSRFHRQLENRVVRSATKITAISNKIISHCINLIPEKSKNISLIYNGFDHDDFTPADPEPSAFVLTFVGAATQWADPSVFFQAVRKALEKEPELNEYLKINIVGTILTGKFFERAREYGIEKHIYFKGYMQHKQAVKELMKSHVLLLAITTGETTGMITGKLFEYLASGKPVLAHVPNGEAFDILKNSHQDVFFHNPGNIDDAADFIVTYYQHKKNRTNQESTKEIPVCDSDFLRQYSRKYQAEQFAKLLNDIISM